MIHGNLGQDEAIQHLFFYYRETEAKRHKVTLSNWLWDHPKAPWCINFGMWSDFIFYVHSQKIYPEIGKAARDTAPVKIRITQGHCFCLAAQSCPTLCDPMDCSPPGSSVHGVLQATILEWVAMPFSKGSSQPRDQTLSRDQTCLLSLLHWQACSLLLALPGHPLVLHPLAQLIYFKPDSDSYQIIFPRLFYISKSQSFFFVTFR